MTTVNDRLLTEFLLSSQLSAGPLVGGLREGYEPAVRQYQFVYHETTGYLATYLAHRAARLRDGLLRERAKSAGEFLLRERTDHGLPYRRMLDGQADSRSFVFDNAIAMQGLLDLAELTRDQRYVEGARAIGSWITGEMIGRDGSVRSYYDHRTRRRQHEGSDFADDDGVLHAKNAIAWLKLARADRANRKGDRAQARAFLDRVAPHQRIDGAFPAQPGAPTHVFSHAHCYATEGYVYAAFELNDNHYRHIAEQAAEYLCAIQAYDGGIYQYNRSGARASDATAQAIRIWVVLDAAAGTKRYERPIRRALRFLASQVHRSGGIAYTRSLLRRNQTCFTWVAMFAASAAASVNDPAIALEEIY